jgi:caspase domain-containing protein
MRCRKTMATLPLRTRIFLALALLWPGVAAAQGPCETETAGLKALAQGVQLEITAPAELRSGGAVHIAWRAASRLPPKTPVFLAVAIPGEVRAEAPPLPKPAQDGNVEPHLPGVLALPVAARAPLDLAFGAGKTRLLIPLHQPGSRLAGSVDVRVFDAGALVLEGAVVAKTACGERNLSQITKREINVAPGAPEIVVQDPFDIDVPKRIVISNSGRYRLHVFEGRYRVFDLASGAKLVDRAGHNPNFSPTSRFVVADVGDADGRELEVIDLVSQQVIYTAAGPFVGWANGDAFLVDGAFRMGNLSVRPTLISRPAAPSDDAQDQPGDGLGLSAPGSCNACASWSDSPMTLDLDNGIVVFPDTFGGGIGEVYELASGFKACCAAEGGNGLPGPSSKDTDARLKQFVAATYEVRPVEWKPGWNVRGGLAFSHIYDPLAKPDPNTSDQEWYKAAIPLRRQLTLHRALEAQAQSTRIAGLAEGVVLRGDWRQSTRRARTTAEASLREGLLAELSRFGVNAAPPLAREAIPFSNSPASEDAKGRYETENKKLEAEIDKRSKALERRLLVDVPALKPHLGQQKPGELPAFPYGGDLAQGKIILSNQLEGLWRWEVDGNPLWLMQLFTIEGSGAFGQGAIFLLEGQRRAAGRVSNLSKALEGFWEGQYGSTAQQTRLKPQLFFGRYLVVALVASRSIGIYDIKAGQKLALIQNMPQADLLEDARLSVDGRHVIQLNSDGQFFLHEIATGRMALSGRYVDGEIILYTPEAYYWSSYEGAHFVQLRFPGLPGLYSFQQFAAVLNRPEVIKARIAGASAVTPPRLVPPPVVEARLVEGPAGEQRRVVVQARSGEGLARLRLYQDGQLIGEQSLSGPQFAGEIALPATGNARWVTALATDKGGLVSAPQMLPLKPGPGSPARLLGVLVGVDTYAEERLKLTYAKSDARRLANALKASIGRYYGAESLQLLLDAEATPSAIAAALETVVATAEPHDTIVFSFAGHGVKGDDDHYYLTPAGYNSDDSKGTGLSWTQIATILGRAKARVVVILDSCHSGLSGAEGLGTNDDAVVSLLTGARAPMLVLAASKGRQFSYEDPKWGGGAFTHALVEVLQRNWRSADLNGNGVIEVSELYRALRSMVASETQGNQTPWLARQDLIGDFALF